MKIYKKINKNFNNLYGYEELKSIKALNNPILLCIAENQTYQKNIFAIMREGAHAARVQTTQEIAAGFKLDKIPIDFIGVEFEEKGKKSIEELTEELLYPYLTFHGKSEQAIMKQARKINIFTYGEAAKTYEQAEELLQKKLTKEGLSKSTVDDILSQVSFIALGTKEELEKVRALNIKFVDVRDKKCETNDIKDYENVLVQTKANVMYFPTEKNGILYPFIGSGNHNLLDYFKKECVAKSSISALVGLFLQNSLANVKAKDIIKIKRDDIFPALFNYGGELRPQEQLLPLLDNELCYDGTPRYTKEEGQMRVELDICYQLLQQAMQSLENRVKENNDKADKINTIISNIKNYSSETTYYQILIASKMWYANLETIGEKSDKEIRSEYETTIKDINMEFQKMEKERKCAPPPPIPEKKQTKKSTKVSKSKPSKKSTKK